MDMEPDPLESVRAKKRHLADALAGAKSISAAVPELQKQLEIAEWEEDALANRPPGAMSASAFGLADALKRETDFVLTAVPAVPVYSASVTASASAYSASGAAIMYDYVTAIGNQKSPGATAYADRTAGAYRRLQEAQDRADAVAGLLARLGNPLTVKRFDKASAATASAVAGVGESSAAALAMRNLVDAVKGDLWALARHSPKENMTWPAMADRLAIGGSGSPQHQELARLEDPRGRLYERLSTAAKERKPEIDVAGCWTLTLDHSYAVLGLVDLPGVAD